MNWNIVLKCCDFFCPQLKDGIPDKDLFINIVKEEFPQAAQADALEGVEKCFENSEYLK